MVNVATEEGVLIALVIGTLLGLMSGFFLSHFFCR